MLNSKFVPTMRPIYASLANSGKIWTYYKVLVFDAFVREKFFTQWHKISSQKN